MTKFKIFPENIIAAVSQKEDGPMKYESENRAAFLERLGISPQRVVSAHLEHGCNIAIVSGENAGKRLEHRDGLITREKRLFLAVTVADCLPVFLYDPKEHIAGIVHAGWRGLQKEIIKEAIKKFVSVGSAAESILAAIGPGIGPCHFEVREDVAEKFSAYGACIDRNGKIFLDLKKIAGVQLQNSGVVPANIETSTECTYDLPMKYFSFRRDKPEQIQAMLAVIGMI